MGDKQLKAKMIFKHEFEANWNKSTYIPKFGEQVLYDAEVESKNEKGEIISPILPSDNGTGERDKPYTSARIKIGDGVNMVKDLPFVYDWKAELDEAIDNLDLKGYIKVEEGKGLSSNDYTNEDKEKVDTMPIV
jgi:hypothetical protein